MATVNSYKSVRIAAIEDGVIVGGDVDVSGNLSLERADGTMVAVGNVAVGTGAPGADGADGATGAVGPAGPAGSGVGPVLLQETVLPNYTGPTVVVGDGWVDWPNFNVTFTKGAKSICVRLSCHAQITAGPGTMSVGLFEGATLIQAWNQPTNQNGVAFSFDKETVTLTPAAGPHTYKVRIKTSAGNMVGVATTQAIGYPAFLKVVEQ